MQALRPVVCLLAAASLVACGATTTVYGDPSSGTGVAVEVTPTSVAVLPAGRVTFAATVTGTVDTSVRWSVTEAAGGTIDATGRYVAPAGAGAFHVVATSAADPTVTATASVTVTPQPVVAVAVSPHTASVAVGRTLTLTAVVTGTTVGQSTAATWSVQEAGGGSVSASGVYTPPATPGGPYHVRATSVADPSKSDTATITVTPAAVAGSPWVVGYWNAYSHNWSANPVLDFSGMTHLAVAHLLTQPGGGLTYGYGLSANAQGNNDRPAPGTSSDLARSQWLTAAAKAAGVMPVISIGGSDDPNFGAATRDPAARATFIANLVAFMDAAGFDGVDYDWESGMLASDYPVMAAISQEIKAARPGTLVMWALPNWGAGAQAAAVAPYSDQLNVMTYDMGATGTWYHAALYGTASNGATGWNSDSGIRNLLNAGVPAAKIGIGSPFYGYDYPGTATAPGQAAGGRSMVNYNTLVGNLRTAGFRYAFDQGTRSPAIFDGATHWYGYEDEASIREKADYVKSLGLGGAIVFAAPQSEFTQGSPGAVGVAVRRNPLLDAAKRYFLGRLPNPAPRHGGLARVAAAAGNAATVDVSGLGAAVVSFSVTTASFISGGGGTIIDTIFDRSIAGPTHGIPVDYDIDVLRGGTWASGVVHVTGNNLGSRIHVIDLTGATQVRMRLTTVNAQYAGNVDLVVHDARAGTDDTMLILGDSNCALQQSGTGSGEGGRLGYEVHQRDASRWPVIVPGGTSQATMGSFLETATYGMPRIRYWLQQLPVKYVALQIGTNDINAVAQPATTAQLDAMQANMESLIKECLAAGRTVVLPRLRWQNGAAAAFPGGVKTAMTQNMEAWHARLDVLLAKYPSALAGPDVYSPSKDRPDLINSDGVHPNQAGVNQSMAVWADWMMANVYTAP